MFVCQTCYAEYREERATCIRDATPLVPLIDEPLRGHIIDRKYRLEKRLGAGGMSAVYLANRLAIGDSAAIKILNRNLISDEQGHRRFEQEARLAASVKHPNVVAIYDFGATEYQTSYLVMEYLEGPTLAQELRRAGGLSLERALEIFQPVCAAVDAAHKEGLIHRDVKPNNIILQQLKRGDEFIKVVDFGIAKLLDDPARLNQHLSGSNVFGTLGYMPFEQLAGMPLDARTDIYGLAVTLYQMLAARMPYAATTIVELYQQMNDGRLRPLRERRPDITPLVEQVILQALATDRDKRPATPRELFQSLISAAKAQTFRRRSDTTPGDDPEKLALLKPQSDNGKMLELTDIGGYREFLEQKNLVNSPNTNLINSSNANLANSSNANPVNSPGAAPASSADANLVSSSNVTLVDLSDNSLPSAANSSTNSANTKLSSLAEIAPTNSTSTTPPGSPKRDSVSSSNTNLNGLPNLGSTAGTVDQQAWVINRQKPVIPVSPNAGSTATEKSHSSDSAARAKLQNPPIAPSDDLSVDAELDSFLKRIEPRVSGTVRGELSTTESRDREPQGFDETIAYQGDSIPGVRREAGNNQREASLIRRDDLSANRAAAPEPFSDESVALDPMWIDISQLEDPQLVELTDSTDSINSAAPVEQFSDHWDGEKALDTGVDHVLDIDARGYYRTPELKQPTVKNSAKKTRATRRVGRGTKGHAVIAREIEPTDRPLSNDRPVSDQVGEDSLARGDEREAVIVSVSDFSALNESMDSDARDTVSLDPATVMLESFVPAQPDLSLPFEPELRLPVGRLNFNKFIAREAELLSMQHHYQRAIAGSASALIVIGEPGVGKSQLLAAYRRWLESVGANTRSTRYCDHGKEREPYQSFFELLGGIPAELKLEGSDELNPQLDKWQIFESLNRYIQKLTEPAPLVILLEDLHWADSLSLELLGYIMRNCIDARLQLVASAREEEAETVGCLLREWLIEQSRYRSYELLRLAAFTRTELRLLLESIFGNLQIAEQELERLHNETAGNPYFLCEVLRFLIENGDLTPAESGWRLMPLAEFELPASIINLVSLKLRRFLPAELDLFAHAAVIGDEFSFETLRLMTDLDEQELESVLNKGVREWVLKEQLTARASDYRFYHTTISRVLYNSIARRHRKKMHARVAAALEKVYRTNRSRYAATLAYHHFHAMNWLPAFDYAVTAGDAAHAQQAMQPAAQYYQWASEAVEQLRADKLEQMRADNLAQSSADNAERADIRNAEREFRMRINYAHALLVLGRISDAQLEVDAAERLLAVTPISNQPDSPASSHQPNRVATDRAWAGFMQSRVAQFRGDFHQSAAACEAGLKELVAVNGESSEIGRRLLHQQGYTCYMLGKLAESRAALERCAEYAHADGDIKMAGGASSLLGLVLAYIGNRNEGLQTARKGLEMLRRGGDRMGELVGCERLGIINDLLGQYQAALDWYLEGLTLAKTLAHRKQELTLLINIGENYRLQGNFEQAEQNYQQALALAQEFDHRDVQSTAIYNLGLVALARGNYQEAARQLGQALTMLCAQGRQHPEAEVLCELARARTGLGEWHDALDLYRASLSLCQKLSFADCEWRAQAGIARCYFHLGDYKRSKASLQAAISLIERLRDQLPSEADRELFMSDKQEVYDQVALLLEKS